VVYTSPVCFYEVLEKATPLQHGKKMRTNLAQWLHCNPSYSGGGDWEDGGSKPVQTKSLQGTPSQPIKASMVVHTCHPSETRNIKRRTMVQPGLGINTRPSKNN
jgi:hypothetical protein